NDDATLCAGRCGRAVARVWTHSRARHRSKPRTLRRDAGLDARVKPPATAAVFRRKLVAWYRKNHRKLPWRETRDPYRVLVSELMLQQTQVSRVLEFYDRFLKRFPTLGALANARPAQVMESWEGLGYYARARNLHALARHVTT